jgi:hypothetical protein
METVAEIENKIKRSQDFNYLGAGKKIPCTGRDPASPSLAPPLMERGRCVCMQEIKTLALATSACGLYFLIINWAGLRLVVHCVSVY